MLDRIQPTNSNYGVPSYQDGKRNFSANFIASNGFVYKSNPLYFASLPEDHKKRPGPGNFSVYNENMRPLYVTAMVMLTVSATSYGAEVGSSGNADLSRKAVILNDEGVSALGAERWNQAIEKLEAALAADPSADFARTNLGIAHNNFGLYLLSHDSNPMQAIKELHLASYIDPYNRTTVGDLDSVIKRHFHLNPKIRADRIKLGDQAMRSNDLPGAVVEYRLALSIKSDSQLHIKLANVYRRLDEKDKAAAEYAAAYKD